MSSLKDEFELIVKTLDQESQDIKTIRERLNKLTNAFDQTHQQFTTNNQILADCYKTLQLCDEKIDSCLNEVEKKHKKLNEEIVELISNVSDKIRNENKEYFRDLEDTLLRKLDDNRLQIKQLIESERRQIRDIFEIEFSKRTNELKQTFESELSKQTKQVHDIINTSNTLLNSKLIEYFTKLDKNQTITKISCWIIGTVSIILLVTILFMS